MPTAPLPAPTESGRYEPGANARDRLGALALSLLVTALVLWMLVRLGLIPDIVRSPQPPTVMQLLPGEQAEQATRAPSLAKPRSGGHSTTAHRAVVTPPPRPTPPTPPVTKPVPWTVIPLSGSQFAAADIGSLPSHAAAGRGAGQGQEQGDGDEGGSSGNGQGAGGDHYYKVDWYRRPTRAEMEPYLSAVRRSGWGDIACRMVEDYRVEDCRELDETPGSGIARAARQAAWQFRVLPPRIGHRPLIGAWVVIHYTIDQDAAQG